MARSHKNSHAFCATNIAQKTLPPVQCRVGRFHKHQSGLWCERWECEICGARLGQGRGRLAVGIDSETERGAIKAGYVPRSESTLTHSDSGQTFNVLLPGDDKDLWPPPFPPPRVYTSHWVLMTSRTPRKNLFRSDEVRFIASYLNLKNPKEKYLQ